MMLFMGHSGIQNVGIFCLNVCGTFSLPLCEKIYCFVYYIQVDDVSLKAANKLVRRRGLKYLHETPPFEQTCSDLARLASSFRSI